MNIFGEKIINWYQVNQRALPWRQTKDPYKIWLSEIILQQTRVQQGLPYYQTFVNNFPNVKDLALAGEDKVLHLWQGLGYYSRARNLLKAAKYIVAEHGSVFPDNFSDLKKIIGIGDYTAAAIASFAFGEKVAVVDGNVYRVLSRYFGIDIFIDTTEGKKIFQQLAHDLIRYHEPDLFNQSIMEFGALQCTPKKTNCSICPLNNDCAAFLQNKVSLYPFKQKKIIKRDRFFYFLIRVKGKQLLIQKRKSGDIWEGMYQFPLIETTSVINFELTDFIAQNQLKDVLVLFSEVKKHLLTHQNIFYNFIFTKKCIESKEDLWIPIEKFNTLAMPQLIKKHLPDIQNFINNK